MLEIRQLNYRVKQKTILRDVNLQVAPAQMVGVLGPNGAGKTTLLKHLAGQIESNNNVFWQSQDISQMSIVDRARHIAVVNQFNSNVFALNLKQIVTMGRLPHLSMFKASSLSDRQSVDDAIDLVDLSDKAEQAYHTLSGGEQQRGLIARALAQRADVIILDEPVNHLDVYYQHQVMQLLQSLAKQMKLTIVMSLHDVNLAATYCDNLCLMQQGSIVAQGAAQTVLCEPTLHRVFSIPCKIRLGIGNSPLRVEFYPPDEITSSHYVEANT